MTTPLKNAPAGALRELRGWWVWVGIVILLAYSVRFYGADFERNRFLAKNLLLFDSFLPELWSLWTGDLGTGEIENQPAGPDVGEFAPWDRFPILAVAVLQSLSAFLLGWTALRFAKLEQFMDRCERWFFAGAIGWQISSVVYLMVGLSGAAKWAGWVNVVMAAAATPILLRYPSDSTGQTDELDQHASVSPVVRRSLTSICLVMGAFYLLFAAVPSAEFDVREYHLQIPREWFQQGSIEFVPHNVYGNMPMGAELHAMGAMAFFPGEWGWWNGAVAGKVSIACLTLLTGLGVFCYARRYYGEQVAWIAAVILLSTPWLFAVSTKGLVEGVFGLYIFATLYALRRAHECDVSSRRWMLVVGFLLGGATSIKYTAVVFLLLPVTAWILFLWRKKIRYAMVLTAIGLLAVTLSSGLWYAKNLAFSGNPVYPLLARQLGGRSWTEEQNERWQAAHSPQPNSLGQQYSTGQLFTSVRDVTIVSPLLSPLLIPGMILGAFVGWSCSTVRQWFAYIAIVFFLWWLATHRLDRFLVPLIPLIAVLAALGLQALVAQQRTQGLVVVLIVLACFMQWMLNLTRFPYGDPRVFVSYQTMRIDPTYLRLHPAHAWLNTRLRDGETAMLVGDAQPFDVNSSVYYNTCFDDTWLEHLVEGKSADEAVAELQRRRIRYVFVHWSELKRYRSAGNYGYSDYPTPERFDQLVNDGVLSRTAVVTGQLTTLRPSSGEMYVVNWK